MKRFVTALVAVALLAAACGNDVGDAGPITTPPDPTPATTTTTSEPGTAPTVATTEPPPDTTMSPVDNVDRQFVEVFFVEDGSAQAVIRAVETPAVAGNAIRELIAGPTAQEADAGLATAVPANTLLLGLTIDGGLATIDLSREFEVGGGSYNILSRLAQVVYTLTQFPTVDRVLFHLDGQPVDVFSGEGVVLEDPVGRADYATILPLAPQPGGEVGEPWSQADLPDISGIADARLRRVALVASDDVLNVREDPGVQSPIVGMLLPGVVVARGELGQEAQVGSTTWIDIRTPVGGAFWVSEIYLAAVVPPDEFAADAAVDALLDEFAAVIAADGDLRNVTSRRGLYVAHHGDPVRFTPGELETILLDPATYRWPSNAADIDEVPARTFASAITDSFLSAYEDGDTVTTLNTPIAGGNGRLPEHAIPFEFQSFNYVGVHDPGDNPEYSGLDWVTWYVSIDYEDGAPVIVGLTIDQWAP